MSQLQPKISVVICTFNRAMLLDECLSSLMKQSVKPSVYEIVVVDNNSTDTTVELTSRYKKIHDGLRLVVETKQGLSHARNKGFRSSKAHWIIYLDDDARVPDTFIERALFVADGWDFDCFGGVYLPWYKFGRPSWYRDAYVSNRGEMDKIGVLGEDYVCGGIIAFKKSVLEQYAGFPVHVGMSGLRLAYGEENYLQKKIRDGGGVIGFDPDWVMEHLVSEVKLNPWWFVKSKYAVGRDSVVVYDMSWGWCFLCRRISEALAFLLLDTIKALMRLSERDFYLQNIVVDIFAVFACKTGTILAISRKKLATRVN